MCFETRECGGGRGRRERGELGRMWGDRLDVVCEEEVGERRVYWSNIRVVVGFCCFLLNM